jgi:hypothetical protein
MRISHNINPSVDIYLAGALKVEISDLMGGTSCYRLSLVWATLKTIASSAILDL